MEVILETFFDVARAVHTNLIEEEGEPLAVGGRRIAIPVGHHAIETIKLWKR